MTPTRRQTLEATAGGAAALTVGTGLTVAGGGGGGGDGDESCDVPKDEYLAVRDEYAQTGAFAAAIEPLDGLRAELAGHGVESGEFLEVNTHVATVDCEPVPEYHVLWGTDEGGGVDLTVRPESDTYRATYRPDVDRGGGGGDRDCYRIVAEGYGGCTRESPCCDCEETVLERDNYWFCLRTCENDCEACPGACGKVVEPEPVPQYEDLELCC